MIKDISNYSSLPWYYKTITLIEKGHRDEKAEVLGGSTVVGVVPWRASAYVVNRHHRQISKSINLTSLYTEKWKKSK